MSSPQPEIPRVVAFAVLWIKFFLATYLSFVLVLLYPFATFSEAVLPQFVCYMRVCVCGLYTFMWTQNPVLFEFWSEISCQPLVCPTGCSVHERVSVARSKYFLVWFFLFLFFFLIIK